MTGFKPEPAPEYEPAPRFEEPQRGQSLSVGDFGGSGFEELDNDDGDLPF